jgi:hypothetical protein
MLLQLLQRRSKTRDFKSFAQKKSWKIFEAGVSRGTKVPHA